MSLPDLPPKVVARLATALRTGMVGRDASAARWRVAVGAEHAEAAREAAERLAERGLEGRAAAAALELLAEHQGRRAPVDLVWSGPTVPGLHARDTRQVLEELLSAARRSLWISTFTWWDGQRAFQPLAEAMDTRPELRVRLMLNIARRDARSPEGVERFAERFWGREWPGARRPEVFYDPRPLEGGGAVLHAKAVVVDEEVLFVTSANLTEAALDRNIELGLLVRDPPLARAVAVHFAALVERGLLAPLPKPAG